MQAIGKLYEIILGAGEKRPEEKRLGFGTFLGVFLPSLITMIGSLLYLKLGWILGQVGLGRSILVLSVGLIITIITALSIASTASNMKIKEGGTYFMLSRSFGFEIGASIGIALYIAHVISICLCVLGFSESIQPMLPGISVRTIALFTLAFLTMLSLVSTALALRMQFIILFFILFSLGCIFFGKYPAVAIESSPPIGEFRFWTIFGFLFPALTGIEAGCAMSGELKEPRYSLMWGPILAAITGFGFYLLIMILMWVKVPAIALITDHQIVEHIVGSSPWAMTGLWAATIASALGCMLSAPRTLKAIAEDGIFKSCKSLQVSILITTVLAGFGIYFGSIQVVIPLLTLVVLIIYGALNLATGVEELISNPSWRPTFEISPKISLLGAFVSFLAMLLMNAADLFIMSILLALLYFFVKSKKSLGKWEDLRESILFSFSRYAIYKLANTKPSARSWRPNFLILSESAGNYSPLLSLANQMTHQQGFLTLASVLKQSIVKVDEIERWEGVIKENLKKNNMEALVEVVVAKSLPIGLENIITSYGMGPLVPNTVVLGECIDETKLDNYVKVIEIAIQARRNVLIIRGDQSLDGKEIDIWWDEESRQNSELMILLANLLTRNKKWQGAQMSLKSIAYNGTAFEERRQYFENYLESARLGIENKVYQVNHSSEVEQTILANSTKLGIVFIGLEPPETSDFKSYYIQKMKGLRAIPKAAFVICRQKLDLKGIL